MDTKGPVPWMPKDSIEGEKWGDVGQRGFRGPHFQVEETNSPKLWKGGELH